MGWLSNLFGFGGNPKKNETSDAPDDWQGGKAAPKRTPLDRGATSRNARPSHARRTTDDPRVDGWVNWNFCLREEVVGVQYRREDALWVLKNAREGDAIELVRDPNNPHDSNAIKVIFRGRHVGFLDRGLAASAAERLPTGMPIRAEFISGWRGETGYVRLTIQPLMPDAKSRKKNGWVVTRR